LLQIFEEEIKGKKSRQATFKQKDVFPTFFLQKCDNSSQDEQI
jgi:hypothetical protein